MAPTSMNDLFAFLTELMTEHAALFETMGSRMFRSFAIIVIVWFGVKNALASASGGMGTAFHFDHFASLLLRIAFGFGMLSYYSHPIPGFGVSFSHLVTDQGLYLANQLDHSLTEELQGRFANVYSAIETPGLITLLNPLEVIRFAVTMLAIIIAQVAVFAVIGFGYVATAIAVLLGPVFIPFFIVPELEWIFWGWLRSFLQYAFYPVVANAYVFVFGRLLIRFMDYHPPPYDGAAMVILFGPFMILIVAFIYGIFKIPSLVNSLFTGRSGEAGLPRL